MMLKDLTSNDKIMSLFNSLPIEILLHIYSFDSTYQSKYNKCIDEINYFNKKHQWIVFTYNNVLDSEKLYFKQFDYNFSKFIKMKLNKVLN